MPWMPWVADTLLILIISCCLCGTRSEPSTTQLQRTLSPAPALLQETWNSYYQELEAVTVDGSSLVEKIGLFKQYGFSLTPHQLRRATVNTARNARVRRLVRTLLYGRKHVKVGVIGTSVSWGTGPSSRGSTDYVSMLPTAMQMVFPSTNSTARNGCFPATGSGFANMCLSHMLDPDVDLILVEFVTNDFVMDQLVNNTFAVTFERLIRKALQFKHKPVVALIQVPTWGQMFNSSQVGHRLWHESAEVLYSPLSQYYSLPVLSFRNAWWVDAESGSPLAPGGWAQLTTDQVHPNDLGHRSMLDMVIWLLMQTALDLTIMPMTKYEAASIADPLPAPMYPGNWEESASMCKLDDELISIVDAAKTQGWQFVNEGTQVKKKQGYVSIETGSKLVFTLDLESILGPQNYSQPGPQHKVGVALAYLQSYGDMGQAVWSCVEGCECKDKVLDAHHTQRTSTTFMALSDTRATSPTCTMTLTNGPGSSSQGHKFKVSAIMAGRWSAMGFHWSTNSSAEWKLHDWFSGNFE